MQTEVKEKLSPAAKDLLRKLFQLKANERPTASEILEHEWLYNLHNSKKSGEISHRENKIE